MAGIEDSPGTIRPKRALTLRTSVRAATAYLRSSAREAVERSHELGGRGVQGGRGRGCCRRCEGRRGRDRGTRTAARADLAAGGDTRDMASGAIDADYAPGLPAGAADGGRELARCHAHGGKQ